MHSACRTYNYQILKLLLEYQANPNNLDWWGRSALEFLLVQIELDLSIKRNHLCVAQKLILLLLKYGSILNIKDTNKFNWLKPLIKKYRALNKTLLKQLPQELIDEILINELIEKEDY